MVVGQQQMKLLLEHVNKLASVEGVNDAFIVANYSAIALILSLFLQGKKRLNYQLKKQMLKIILRNKINN